MTIIIMNDQIKLILSNVKKENYLYLIQVIDKFVDELDTDTYENIVTESFDKIHNLYILMINVVRLIIKKHSTNKNKDNTYICYANTQSVIDLFLIYCKIITFQKERLFVGVDYEFNRPHLGLMQVCFFDNNFRFVFLSHPNIDFTIGQNKKLCLDFYMNNKISFIFHGSDSLDINYIISFFNLNNMTQYFTSFLNRSYDTRFLCEFKKYKIGFNNNKCSLYIALLFAHSIDMKQYNALQKIEEKLHPIYKTNWLIISSAIINYAINDVIHLLSLYDNLRDDASELVMEMYRLTMIIKYGFYKIESNKIKDMKDTKTINNNNFKIIKNITTFKKSINIIEKMFHTDKTQLINILGKYKLINLKEIILFLN